MLILPFIVQELFSGQESHWPTGRQMAKLIVSNRFQYELAIIRNNSFLGAFSGLGSLGEGF